MTTVHLKVNWTATDARYSIHWIFVVGWINQKSNFLVMQFSLLWNLIDECYLFSCRNLDNTVHSPDLQVLDLICSQFFASLTIAGFVPIKLIDKSLVGRLFCKKSSDPSNDIESINLIVWKWIYFKLLLVIVVVGIQLII